MVNKKRNIKATVSFKAIAKLPTIGDVIKLDNETRNILGSPRPRKRLLTKSDIKKVNRQTRKILRLPKRRRK